MARYRDGAPGGSRTPELDALAKAEQALRFKTDAWAERAADWLVGRNDVSVGEVLVGALGIGQDSWSRRRRTGSPPFWAPMVSSNTDRVRQDNRAPHAIAGSSRSSRSISSKSSSTKVLLGNHDDHDFRSDFRETSSSVRCRVCVVAPDAEGCRVDSKGDRTASSKFFPDFRAALNQVQTRM